MKKLFPLLIIILFGFSTPASASDMVTVRLEKNDRGISELPFRFRGRYFTPDLRLFLKENHTYHLTVKNNHLYLIDGKDALNVGASFILAPKEYDTDHILFLNGHPYLGAMLFRAEGQNVRPVNQLALEDYLKGVVPFEVYPAWHMEALKAQALAARTYAVSHMNREMVDTIQDQVYGGYLWNSRTSQAVEETKGEVMTHNGRLIDAFYSASNGGITENNQHVWGGEAKSFYPIKKDPYDPKHPWRFTFRQIQISQSQPISWGKTKEKDAKIIEPVKLWLQRQGFGDDVKILAIPRLVIHNKKNAAERAVKGSITIEFLRNQYGIIRYERVEMKDVPLNRIRPIFGGELFRSYLVDASSCDGGVCSVEGRGYGHGVGMSQWGASVMGESGKSYKDILQYYFPGTKIQHISEDSKTNKTND
ncbi:MAG: SpoIID/LytB domain-containing protein [Tuberibacillus sp.]